MSDPRQAARPGPLVRWLYRVPLTLERFGVHGLDRVIGSVLGVEWIVLETVGRRSGRPHVVVLDLVGHDATRDTWYVQPAYGRRAQWVRNALHAPQVMVRVAGRRFVARVRDATGDEGAEVVLRFIREHPRYARLVVWFVGYVDSIDRPDDELRRALASTPVLAIEAMPAS